MLPVRWRRRKCLRGVAPSTERPSPIGRSRRCCARSATSPPLLLLCAARPELLERRPGWGGGKRNYVTIGLEALSTVETDQLVQSLLPGDEMPEQLRRGITRKAEGNPFYVEEIIRMLVDRGI